VESTAEAADRGRRVEHYASSPSCPAALTLTGPDHLLSAAHAQLDADARAARRAGAPETLDQLRFDLAVAALTRGAFGLVMTQAPVQAEAAPVRSTPPVRRAQVLVQLVSTPQAMLGLDGSPATLRTPSGDVRIPAALARQLAHDDQAVWQRILCDPATGVATDISPRYAPPRRIAEFVAARDGHTARFPTSGARTLELDHVIEYDHDAPTEGGPTTPANLAAAGKRDHQDKTDRVVTVSGNANGVLTYSTGTGHHYQSWPHQYLDPDPPPPW
jgi:hypothetical protein